MAGGTMGENFSPTEVIEEEWGKYSEGKISVSAFQPLRNVFPVSMYSTTHQAFFIVSGAH
jgi:hypothetical protein